MNETAIPDSFNCNRLILLVDDEDNILSSLRRLLEEEDYGVITANSGAKGLQILDENPVDLIISDMRMPNMDGATFLQQVAQHWPESIRILLTGFSDMKSTIAAVNEGHIYQYITKPWNDEDLLRRVKNALEVKQLREYSRHLERIQAEQNKRLLELTEHQEEIIKHRTAELEQTASQLEMAYQELQETYFQTVPLLANLVELNERYKKQHSKRVANCVELMVKQMELNDHDVRQYLIAALLHDIGKIGIDPAILGKSPQEMTPKELQHYQQHAQLGETALLSYDPLREASLIIRHHHERFDGKGFPDRLAGSNIPLGSRMIAIADDYDNLQLPNNFLGRVLTDSQAFEFIMSEAGKRYDPNVADVFRKVIEQVREGNADSREILLSIDKVRPGMRLSRDLLNHYGMVMLAAGKALTENHILKLKQFEKTFDTHLQLAIQQPGNTV